MPEREFLIYLDPETRLCRYRHYHVSKGKETKDWFEGYSVEEVLTIGQKDIMENWTTYRERFIKEMKK